MPGNVLPSTVVSVPDTVIAGEGRHTTSTPPRSSPTPTSTTRASVTRDVPGQKTGALANCCAGSRSMTP